MSSHVNATALRASAEAVRVLVSPLHHASEAAWRTAVHAALRSLFAADHTMSIMAGPGELIRSEDIDPSVLRSLRSWFDAFTPEGRLTMADPVVNQWNDRRRASVIPVYTRDLIDHVIDHRVVESPYVNEALVPNGIQYWQGLYGRGPSNSDAVLWVSYARRDHEPFGEAAIPLLSLLAPAFQSGLDALGRLGDARAALDALAHPLILFDADGRELHRTAAFTELTRQPEGPALVARARALAMTFGAGRSRIPSAATSSRVSTGGGDVVLRVTLLPEGLVSPLPAVAVLAHAHTRPVFPDAAALEAAHGLTPREAEVALHVARGATRDRIAEALGISPHTARAHTEKVFAKLGVTRRGAVAAASSTPAAGFVDALPPAGLLGRTSDSGLASRTQLEVGNSTRGLRRPHEACRVRLRLSRSMMEIHMTSPTPSALLRLSLPLVGALACSDVTAPPPSEADGAFSAVTSGAAVRSLAGRAVFATDVPGPEYGFAIALVDSIRVEGQPAVRHAVYLYRDAAGTPGTGEHAVGPDVTFRAGIVLDGEGDDPLLCVAVGGGLEVDETTLDAVRGTFELQAACYHMGAGAPSDTIVARGSFRAVGGAVAVPDGVAELPELGGRYELRAAGGAPLPASVFDGLVLVGEDTFVHLVITATDSHLALDGTGGYEHRVSQEVHVDGQPAPSLDWVDRGTCARTGGTLHCLSALVANRSFIVTLDGETLELTQDLTGEGVAVTYRYERER